MLFSQFSPEERREADSTFAYALNPEHPIEKRMWSFHVAMRMTIYGEVGLGLERAYVYLDTVRAYKAVSEEIDALHFLGAGYLILGKLDSVEFYHGKALELARKHGNAKKEAEALADLGNLYVSIGDLEKGFEFHHKCLEISEENKMAIPLARARINLGEIYELQGNYGESLKFFREALELCEKHNFGGFFAAIFTHLGDVNLAIGEYTKAEEYYGKALHYSTVIPNTRKRTRALEMLGVLELERGSDSVALQHFRNALEVAESSRIAQDIARLQMRIAEVDFRKSDYDSAGIRIEGSIAFFEKNDSEEGYAEALLLAGAIYRELGQVAQSEAMYEKGYRVAKQSNIVLVLEQASFELFQIHKKNGNSRKSLMYFEEYVDLKNMRRDKEDIKAVVKMELDKAYREQKIADSLGELKDSEIREMKYQQDRDRRAWYTNLAWSGALFILLLFLLVLTLFLRKRKSNRELAMKNREIEQALKDKGILLKEVHHRVKNNMQVVSSLLYFKAKSTKDASVKAALKESQLRIRSLELAHQRMYQNDNFEEIDIVEYAREILDLLVRNDGGQNEDFLVEGEPIMLVVEKAQALGFVLHELIVNSLKYAWDEAGGRSIRISITVSGEEVRVDYADNGEGLPENFDMKGGKSLGMKLVHSLVERQLLGTIAVMPGEGARFVIKFKQAS